MNKLYTWIAVAALSAGIAFVSPSFAQAPGGAKGGAPKGKAPATNLPTQPIAVPLPTMMVSPSLICVPLTACTTPRAVCSRTSPMVNWTVPISPTATCVAAASTAAAC